MADDPAEGTLASMTLGALRERVVFFAGRTARYAEHASSYAEIGDDAGLNRSVRLMAEAAVKAAETLPALNEASRQDRAIRQAAREVAR